MSFVLVLPPAVALAATDLSLVAAAVDAAAHTALTPTTQLLAAAQDEVSADIAALFSAHGRHIQLATAQVGALQGQFIHALEAGATSYAAADAAGVEQLLLDVLNAPTRALVGRPLIGDGANGAPAERESAARPGAPALPMWAAQPATAGRAAVVVRADPPSR
ncbi:MAG: PE family protein [Mycobacterium sp.]|nr:MAG: PE family protein [Mycobacterium sp.]